jgi:predicted nucleotidyltransferase
MKKSNDKTLQLLIDKAVTVLRAFGATEVYLFCSARKCDFDPASSDLDFAVRGIAPKDFFSAVGETLCALGQDVDIIDLDAGTTFGRYLTEHDELSRVA